VLGWRRGRRWRIRGLRILRIGPREATSTWSIQKEEVCGACIRTYLRMMVVVGGMAGAAGVSGGSRLLSIFLLFRPSCVAC